ncbi:uncharacterized protein TRAVEDRAFT_64793 [Trametes versicolor FP-101664 SS1]|uniref:uncharacterized protein n=1 Tax=Trametes versicolor (strain FP-101664) TaxID=717944 RepID=UPI0004621861|nr:uncharacterized protein TRAVEDRAFT_64793 [Trametes versicolor FP-101664 SS1]EIW58266.1 hypothetical protein TRAVEDRAFT_64793 [Trametes versicolor FP-101664 SS1]
MYLKMADLLSALPVELVSIIGHTSAPSDLAALLLANKTLNEHLTPTLYASVDIQHYNHAQSCIRTLSAEASTLAFGRDLAALVRFFSLRYAYSIYSKPPGVAELARRLSRAVGRMTGLQHFTLAATATCTTNVCAALARSAAPTLRSLTIAADSQSRWAHGSDVGMLRDVRTVFPELISVSLVLSKEAQWLDFFERILTPRAGHLRHLSFKVGSAPLLLSLVRNTPSWAQLQELELDVPNVPLANLPSTPNVRKLTLSSPKASDALAQLVLPSDAFPALEVLACPYQFLPTFLPEDAQPQRPIRTVRLNNACYDEVDGIGDFPLHEPYPRWEELLEVLCCLPRSAGPVTDLSFYVDWFDASVFGVDLAPYTATLERLVVMLHEDLGGESAIATFGETLFAHTPKLHTFLLSDGPMRADDFKTIFRGDPEWLEEWDKHPNALKNVAFTTGEGVWTKTDDGWQAPPRNEDSDDEGDDDEDEDEDEEDEDEDDDDEDDDDDDDDAVESDGSVVGESN